jgi:hypothetical protein
MKSIMLFIALLFATAFASAADVTAKMVVKVGDAVKLEQTTVLHNVTDAQAQDLKVSGMKTLDMAAKHQDKGGAYSIEWTWNSEPTIVTPGMKWGAVNSVLHAGTKWLDSHIIKVEKK